MTAVAEGRKWTGQPGKREYTVNGKMKEKMNVSTLGVALGVLVVIVSVVWVAILSLGRDKYTGNEITWVG